MSHFSNLLSALLLTALFFIANVSSLQVLKDKRCKSFNPKQHTLTMTMKSPSTSSLWTSLSSRVAPVLVAMSPSIALADDEGRNAIVFPLAISFLTIVPFIIYQQ
jgi:hypothetical protein